MSNIQSHNYAFYTLDKDETILSVIKRLFGEHVTSRLVRTQNRELSLRCIAYNMHRLTNLIIILMVSTKSFDSKTNTLPLLISVAAIYLRNLYTDLYSDSDKQELKYKIRDLT